MKADTAVRRKKLNDFLKQVNNDNIRFGLFKGINKGIYFAMIEIELAEIEKHAATMEFPVKLNGLSAKVPFKPAWKDKVAPFRSSDMQSIIIDKLKTSFDLQNLKE